MAKSKLNQKIDELKAAYPEAKIDDLFNALANAELDKEQAFSKVDKLQKEIDQADEDVEALNQRLSDFESGKVKKLPKPTVKVSGVEYTIDRPQVKAKGVLFTAQQIKENKDTVIHTNNGKQTEMKIAHFLVEIKSGVLVVKPKS